MNPEFVCSSECYLQKRDRINKSFGGNYRRTSDSFTVPSSVTGDTPRLQRCGLKSFSFCYRNCLGESSHQPFTRSFSSTNSENQQLPNNSFQHSDHLWEKTLVVYSEKPSKDFDSSHRTNPSVGNWNNIEREESELRISCTGNRELLPLLMEDETSHVSVMECIKSFEQIDQKSCTGVDDKPNPITKTRVAELRETLLRRSSENLPDACFSTLTRINKRPASAVLERSFGTFPKIPINTIQRRSIGTFFQPSLSDIGQSPVTDDLKLQATGVPLSSKVSHFANKRELHMDTNQRENNNSVYMQSFIRGKNLLKHNLISDQNSLKWRPKLESCSHAIADRNSSCDRRSDADASLRCLVKTDSSDSGIDTKADCIGNRSASEAVESFPERKCQSAAAALEGVNVSSQSCLIDISDNVFDAESDPVQLNRVSTEKGNIPEIVKPISTIDFRKSSTLGSVWLNLESDEFAQVGTEEIRYKELVARVLSQLKQHKEDLSAVMLPSKCYRTSFYYIVDAIKGVKIPDSWVNLPNLKFDIEQPGSERAFDENMLELLNCVKHRIEVKKRQKEDIEHKISDRKDFESQVSNIIKFRVEKKKYEKYCLYVSELDKVLHLMFMLASRLANTENIVTSLRIEEDALLVKMLSAKQANLMEKLEDAKLLKDGIDRRSEVVNSFLKLSLSDSEYAAYQRLVLCIVRLHFVHQWTEDCLELYEKQMKALATIQSYSSPAR